MRTVLASTGRTSLDTMWMCAGCRK
jgi:hypothetical protein